MSRAPTALALGLALRKVRARGQTPRVPQAQPAPQLRLDRVGRELGNAPALRVLVAALLVASGAHGFAGAVGLGLRPKKAKAGRMAMAVAPAEEEVPIEEEPPPPPQRPRLAASAAPLASSQAATPPAPGPLLPGLAPSAHAGGGGDLAISVGGAGAQAEDGHALKARAQEPAKVLPPRVLRRTPPSYPKAARANGTQGSVVLQLLVDETGRVREVRVLSAEPAGVFDDAAVAAARGWSFHPARQGDERVQAWVRQTIRFELE